MLKLWLGFVQRLWYRDGGASHADAQTCTVIAEWRPVAAPDTGASETARQLGDMPVVQQDTVASIDAKPGSVGRVGHDPNRFMLSQRLQSVMVLNRAKRRPEDAVDPRARVVARQTMRPQRGRRIAPAVTLTPTASVQAFPDNVIVLAVCSKTDEMKRAA